jgi:beta-N-acetylhexosaminidase
VSLATTVCSLVINDLSTWIPPDGLAQSLRSDDIKYDRVSGSEYTVAVIEHLKRSARTDLLEMYNMALESKETSSIIRAKRTSDSAIMGTLLMLKAESRLARLMPGFSKNSSKGCIAAPVISPATNDRHSMLQGLVLLGVRELKKQGIATVVFDKVSSFDGPFGEAI